MKRNDQQIQILNLFNIVRKKLVPKGCLRYIFFVFFSYCIDRPPPPPPPPSSLFKTGPLSLACEYSLGAMKGGCISRLN